MSDMVEDEIDYESDENQIQECEKCGEPCSSDVCRKCQLLEEIKIAADSSEDHEFSIEE